ncbi:MAG: CIA30 family protein [Pseudomonadota bacterium]
MGVVWRSAVIVVLFAISSLGHANANETMILEDFSDGAQKRWSYVADTVMGGESAGSISFEEENGEGFVRLVGNVSTRNNGGFIQVRTRLASGLAPNRSGLKVRVRGNGETYYIFLRSKFATRPWHSYRLSFTTGPNWRDIELPLNEFQPSRPELPVNISPEDVTGIGIVAYGADFAADLSVATIGTF